MIESRPFHRVQVIRGSTQPEIIVTQERGWVFELFT